MAEAKLAATRSAPTPVGVLVVDKPKGPSSHDVVRRVRKALGTRAVGHAGTLDPMASGVLVLGIGEGTKLLHHLSADDKEYLATITLGAETDTLDADGQPVERCAVPPLDAAQVREAARGFLGETLQRAPAVSAIKQGGVALHERVRRGEDVTPPERLVRVHELEVLSVGADAIDLRVRCGKGFYVRSLARDLARVLGTCGHLSMLRRIKSGGFGVDEAVALDAVQQAERDAAAAEALRSRLLPLAAALRGVPAVRLDATGVVDVRHGRALGRERMTSEQWPSDGAEPVALLDASGALVALGRARGERIEILRGIL